MKKFVEFNKDFYDFIKKNVNSDPKALRLTVCGKKMGFDASFAIDQVEARRKTSRKLSGFISYDRFLFPSALAAEQSTHETVAGYNADILIREGDGGVIDLTAGLGIDAFTLARRGTEVLACELEPGRVQMLCHNAQALGLQEHVKIVCADSLIYLPRLISRLRLREHEDRENISDRPTFCPIPERWRKPMVFIDPARRGEGNSRTYFLEDCVPDITRALPDIFSYAGIVAVKASPILDIRRAAAQLPGLREVHLVAYKGEMKETLLILERGYKGDVALIAVDLGDEDAISRFGSMLSESGSKECPTAEKEDLCEGLYVYDPNAAVHKMQCASALCRTYPGMMRLGRNTDIYVSSEICSDFPGRVFSLREVADSRRMKQIKGTGMSVISRNHPEKAEAIRRKFRFGESETEFLLAASAGQKEKPVYLLLERV